LSISVCLQRFEPSIVTVEAVMTRIVSHPSGQQTHQTEVDFQWLPRRATGCYRRSNSELSMLSRASKAVSMSGAYQEEHADFFAKSGLSSDRSHSPGFKKPEVSPIDRPK